MKENLFRFIEWALAHVSTRIITLSPSLRNELVGFGVAPKEKISIVPLGIELNSFLGLQACVSREGAFRQELGLLGEIPLVGIVGRLVPIKDHSNLIEAFSILINDNSAGRASSAHLVIVGDGELRESLEVQAQSLRISDRIHFVGWRSDLTAIYEGLDLVVLTSRNEGTPLSLIEGMAAARPVVSTWVGGVPDLVEFSKAKDIRSYPFGEFEKVPVGALVRPEDPNGLANAMVFLLEDPERLYEMGKSGRESVRERYSIDRLVADLERIYLKDRKK